MSDPRLAPAPDSSPAAPDAERRQRNRMLVAVFVLLFAVGVVLIRDWGTPPQSAVDNLAPDSSAEVAPPAAAAPAQAATPTATTAPKSARTAARSTRRTPAPAPAKHASSAAPENGIVVTNRAVLPPLQVEVVAGNRHNAVHPGSTSMRVDMDSAPSETSPGPPVEVASAEPAPVTPASGHARISRDAILEVENPVQPDYPMLARQMKVQGSVVLEALISKDGGIQELQVLRGPAILADAARQAVRQWRFKPYLQDGQAVETQAHITVNFTISTN